MNDSDNQSEDCPTFSKRASNDPNFAVVFSFLSLFGSLLNIPEFSLKEFEDGLDNCTDFALDAGELMNPGECRPTRIPGNFPVGP